MTPLTTILLAITMVCLGLAIHSAWVDRRLTRESRRWEALKAAVEANHILDMLKDYAAALDGGDVARMDQIAAHLEAEHAVVMRPRGESEDA